MSPPVTNPFPGPQPYRASDRGRFYGREDISYRLQGSVLANRCVTVYGPSGAGKSSLMQAAVIPALVDAQDISVARVDGWPEGEEPTRWLVRAVYTELGLGEPPEELSAEDALLAAAKRAARRSSRIMLIYLDQIEQLLYASRSVGASEAFFDSLNQLVELPVRNLRVVLSLREDYLGRFRDRLRDHRHLLGKTKPQDRHPTIWYLGSSGYLLYCRHARHDAASHQGRSRTVTVVYALFDDHSPRFPPTPGDKPDTIAGCRTVRQEHSSAAGGGAHGPQASSI
ncbi:uncharacterized protein SOCE26_097400 [Sorangium cellulosum]|uniref:Novel STAND NTPase 1 domain-containing protein n=1 Tax=Sorangium cellulosum TaxID=56 RepID=A0A2L0F9T6_SORCE|nr:AAA family ATPase [Sorangium cellulosum]AUX48209.1 uncharacterized protein SOCE26_097400 [Sorangium cellulosum]